MEFLKDSYLQPSLKEMLPLDDYLEIEDPRFAEHSLKRASLFESFSLNETSSDIESAEFVGEKKKTVKSSSPKFEEEIQLEEIMEKSPRESEVY